MAIVFDDSGDKALAEEALRTLARQVNESMLRAMYGDSVLVASTASVDPSVMNQRSSYRWRGNDELGLVVASTGSVGPGTVMPVPPGRSQAFPYGWEIPPFQPPRPQSETASESKQPPKVEDLPPVFRREIDL